MHKLRKWTVATGMALLCVFSTETASLAAPAPSHTGNVSVEFIRYQKGAGYTTDVETWYYDQASSGWVQCQSGCNDTIVRLVKNHKHYFQLKLAKEAQFLSGAYSRTSPDQTSVYKPTWQGQRLRKVVVDTIDGQRERETVSSMYASVYDPAFAEPPASPCGPSCGK